MVQLLIALLMSLAFVLGVSVLLVLFGGPVQPESSEQVMGAFTRMDLATLPSRERYRARDGAELGFRRYPEGNGPVCVLLHGSFGASQSMHLLAETLRREADATVYSLDLRGHGFNYPHGDVGYIGQLENDVEDFAALFMPEHLARVWVLIGFSLGGGLTLRMAASPQGAAFDRFVMLAPYLHHHAPTVKPKRARERAEWYSFGLPRRAGLFLLNSLGIKAFDHLPVLAFPVPEGVPAATTLYTARMQKNMAPHENYEEDIRKSPRPLTVLVGDRDELFEAKVFEPLFASAGKPETVTVLPAVTHTGIVTMPEAVAAVARVVVWR